MNRTTPAETKLTICVWHPFSEWRPPASLADAILSRWPAMRVVHLPNFDRLPQELPDTDIFVGYSLRPNQFPAARKLKWIHSTATGVAQLAYPELRDSGILVTNPSGLFSVPMAEHAMGLLVALARNFPDSVRHQDRAIWSQQILWDKAPITELNGKILLIVGYGSIGRELARRAAAFGMRVVVCTRTPQRDSKIAERVDSMEGFGRLLAESDFIIVTPPLNDQTRGLFDRRAFAAMRREAVIVNVARGPIIDELALYEALAERRIGGAIIDVWYRYPPQGTPHGPQPSAHPFHELDNVLMTPHASAWTDGLLPRRNRAVATNLNRLARGEPLVNVVRAAEPARRPMERA